MNKLIEKKLHCSILYTCTVILTCRTTKIIFNVFLFKTMKKEMRDANFFTQKTTTLFQWH